MRQLYYVEDSLGRKKYYLEDSSSSGINTTKEEIANALPKLSKREGMIKEISMLLTLKIDPKSIDEIMLSIDKIIKRGLNVKN